MRQKVERIARVAVSDAVANRADHPDMIARSKLGAQGFHKSHVWRDLKRRMKPPAFKPDDVNIPLKSGETDAVDGLVGNVPPYDVCDIVRQIPSKIP